MPANRAVYTALLGGYEELLDQPMAAGSDIPFICLTDDPDLTSETWQIVQVEPMLPLDLVRSQRDFKIRGHDAVAAFDETLYIDNSVLLKVAPEQILDDWLAEKDYAVSLHSYRERVIDEFDEVVALNYDDAGRVHEQLLHYSDLYPELLQQHPYWNGIIARRRTPEVQRALARWFDHVLRFSRRDQLSANVALSLSGLDVNAVDLDNFDSPLHEWPYNVKRKIHLGKNSSRNTGPLLAEVARLKRELASVTATAEEATQRLETYDAERDAAIAELSAELRTVSADHAAVERDLRREIHEILTSSSWKAGAPVRWAGATIRRLRHGGQTH